MYAIIQSGGKQYRVQEGDEIEVELLGEDKGAYSFEDVLFFHDGKKSHVGTPKVAKVQVEGEIVGEVKGPKVIAFKYKRRKNYNKKIGHRQKYAKVRIKKIAKQ